MNVYASHTEDSRGLLVLWREFVEIHDDEPYAWAPEVPRDASMVARLHATLGLPAPTGVRWLGPGPARAWLRDREKKERLAKAAARKAASEAQTAMLIPEPIEIGGQVAAQKRAREKEDATRELAERRVRTK